MLTVTRTREPLGTTSSLSLRVMMWQRAECWEREDGRREKERKRKERKRGSEFDHFS